MADDSMSRERYSADEVPIRSTFGANRMGIQRASLLRHSREPSV